MAAIKKTTYINTELEWAESQLVSWKAYVDADHTSVAVLMDAELSWPLLKTGGVMAFDDYTWGRDLPPSKTPRPGILLFVDHHKDNIDTLVINSQYWIRKK